MMKKLEDLLISCKNLIQDRVSFGYAQEHLNGIRDSAEIVTVTTFLSKLLRLCAMVKMQSRGYFDVFFDSDLVLPNECSKDTQKALKVIVVSFVLMDEQSWFDIPAWVAIPSIVRKLDDIKIEFAYRKLKLISKYFLNCLEGTLDTDLVHLLSWSLQWVTDTVVLFDNPENNLYYYISLNEEVMSRRLETINKKYPAQCDSELSKQYCMNIPNAAPNAAIVYYVSVKE